MTSRTAPTVVAVRRRNGDGAPGPRAGRSCRAQDHPADFGYSVVVRLDEWFLTAAERGNPATVIDSRHGDGSAWTTGNDVRPIVHGAVYFAELLRRVRAMRAGDLLLFTDWRGDPDERLDGPVTGGGRVFRDPARGRRLGKRLRWRVPL